FGMLSMTSMAMENRTSRSFVRLSVSGGIGSRVTGRREQDNLDLRVMSLRREILPAMERRILLSLDPQKADGMSSEAITTLTLRSSSVRQATSLCRLTLTGTEKLMLPYFVRLRASGSSSDQAT